MALLGLASLVDWVLDTAHGARSEQPSRCVFNGKNKKRRGFPRRFLFSSGWSRKILGYEAREGQA